MASSCKATPQEENVLHDEATIQKEQDEDMVIFSPVLTKLQLDRVPSLVLDIRKRMLATKGIDVDFDCDVQKEPLWGAFHILFLIVFVDGAKWLLKIPAAGHSDRFDTAAARSLTSEALTMRYLRCETTIPLPEVYHFDASLENQIHCPFILMEYIDGLPFRDVWFNDKIPKDVLEQHRLRALEDTARSMLQLGRFKFHQGGEPIFDMDGKFADSVSPIRLLDNTAMLRRAETRNGDLDDIHNIFCELGPFDDSRSFLFASLDREPLPNEDEDDFTKGLTKLLRLFLDWVLESRGLEDAGQFVLAHPDFDSQNFIFSPNDGSLRGVIDWDGVASKPQCLGNEVYPGWLTRDWDPVMYGYFLPGDHNAENSPSELQHYRRLYRGFVKKIKLEEQQGDALANEVDIRVTVQSLLVENLYIAAENPICRYGILEKIFKEIARIVAPEIYMEIEKMEELSRAGQHFLQDEPSLARDFELHDGEAEAIGEVESDQTAGGARDDEGEGQYDSKSESDGGAKDEEDEEDYDSSDATEFRFYEVLVALGRNNLEEERSMMLKEGFTKILEEN